MREGTIRDLTKDGCRIETLEPVPVNTYLELRLQISPMAPRMVIELAAVRWATDRELGIEFLGLQLEQKTELQRIMN
jgi:hypothetical protein